MFNFLPAKLETKNGIITISRIANRVMRNDIQRIFKTSRMSKHMFLESSNNTVSFYEFFALEFFYAIETLIESDRSLGTSKRKLRQILELLKNETWIKGTEDDKVALVDYSKLQKFIYDPLAHQQDYFQKFDDTVSHYKLRGILLAAEPGTGKTFSTLALSECLGAEKIIAICPNNAVETVWVKSITGPDRLYKDDQDVYYMSSGKKYNGEKFIVVHYEAIGKLDPTAFGLLSKKCSLILDESHSLNELSSNRTNLFLDLCLKLDCYVLFASGTPIKALSYETIPLLRAIDPLFTGEVEQLFKKIFAGEATALSEILQRRLNIISHKVSKAVLDLNEPIVKDIRLASPNGELYTLKAISRDIEIYVEKRKREIRDRLPEYERTFYRHVDQAEVFFTNPKAFSGHVLRENIDKFSEYRSYVKKINGASRRDTGFLEVREMIPICNRFEKDYIIPRLDKNQKLEFKEAAVCFKYYQLKIKGECLGRILGRKRIEAYRDIVKSIPFEDIIETTEKKTLVFTSFVEVIDETNRALKAQGYKPLLMHGEFTKDLSAVVKRFQDNPDDNPLVATYNALSTAVPLIMADTLIAINPPYRDYIMKQAIARINRIGTTTQTRVFNITLDTGKEPNICDRMLDIVNWSKEQANKVLSLDQDIDVEETSISLESFHGFDEDLIPEVKFSASAMSRW